ncbi:hypothetical protein MRX96_023170 [Rhipicephalus microplus]
MTAAASSSGVKKRRALSLEIKECVTRDIESGLKKGVGGGETRHFRHNRVDHLQKQGQTAAATAARFVFPVTEENTAGFVRNAEALEDDEQSDTSLADETLNTDDVWSCLVDSNFVTATDTFQEFVNAGESELSVWEEASTDDAIVAAVRGSAEVATDDESDGEDDVDPTPEPDFACKDALEYLAKLKTYCAKNSLSEKSLRCLSFVEDEIVRSAVRKHRPTKITALFR